MRKLVLYISSLLLSQLSANIYADNLIINDASAPIVYDGKPFLSALTANSSYVGSIGVFSQTNFGDSGSFLETNISGGYQSGEYNGFRAGAGAILTGKIFSIPHSAFDMAKEIFLLNSLYINYISDEGDINITAGRFKSYEEWNSYYNQGISAYYKALNNLSFNALISYGSAIVSHEYTTEFRTDLLSLNSLYGSYFLGAKYFVKNTNVELNPYLYINSFFSVLGIKGNLFFRLVNDVELISTAHISGYFKYYPQAVPLGLDERFAQTLQNSTKDVHSAIAWIYQSLKWQFLEASAGLIGVSSGGAEMVDYYGQSTPLEYSVGMFYSDAFSLYGGFRASLDDILDIRLALRNSFLPSGNVFGLELGLEGNATRYIKLGGNITSLYNSSNAINFHDGDNFTIIRVFTKYLF